MESAIDWLLNEVQGQGWGFIKVSIPKEVIHQAKTKEYQLVEKAIEFGLLIESDQLKFDYDNYCTLVEQFYAEELKSEIQKKPRIMISPKEEAKELVFKFDDTMEFSTPQRFAKKCALIAVDKILKVAFFAHDDIYNHYLEVKQEIESYENSKKEKV